MHGLVDNLDKEMGSSQATPSTPKINRRGESALASFRQHVLEYKQKGYSLQRIADQIDRRFGIRRHRSTVGNFIKSCMKE